LMLGRLVRSIVAQALTSARLVRPQGLEP
jgi:hypothetical protein